MKCKVGLARTATALADGCKQLAFCNKSQASSRSTDQQPMTVRDCMPSSKQQSAQTFECLPFLEPICTEQTCWVCNPVTSFAILPLQMSQNFKVPSKRPSNNTHRSSPCFNSLPFLDPICTEQTCWVCKPVTSFAILPLRMSQNLKVPSKWPEQMMCSSLVQRTELQLLWHMMVRRQ